MKTKIELFNSADISLLVNAFAEVNWIKPLSLFEKYLSEQHNDLRKIFVAFFDNQIAGYTTLNFRSGYQPFLTDNIPEIQDLNVLPNYRNKGIGTLLIEKCENEVSGNLIGLGVGLYAGDDGGYGPAQKLYIKRGYIPDGNGITYKGKIVNFGESVILDDDLNLWLIKKLR